MKKKILFALLIAAFIVVNWTQQQPATAQEDAKVFVPAFFKGWPYTPSFGVQMINFNSLDKAVEADNYWIRYNGLEWSKIQPNNASEWNWAAVAELEEDLVEASAAGMEIILIIRSTPTWAQKIPGYYCGPMKPGNISDFAAFMRKVVAKYTAKPYNVKYFEIWNEPDVPPIENLEQSQWGCWGDAQAPYFGGGYYAEMLKQVYPAIKSVNPNAQVMLGGLLLDCDPRQPGTTGYCANATAAKPPTFFQGILANGGGNYFDAVSFHGHAQYSTNLSAIQSEARFPNWKANGGLMVGKLDYIDELLSEYNLVKPIFMTEAGLQYLDDTPTSAFEQAKADYVPFLFSRNLARNITGTTWFSFAGNWRFVGLLDYDDFTPLPAYNAYDTITTALDGAAYNKDLNLGAGIIGFEFRKVTRIWTLFSEDGGQKSINTPPNITAAYDLYGDPVDFSGSQITFSRPIYIEFNN